MGIQRDLIPVGREVAGVILQGQKHTNKKVIMGVIANVYYLSSILQWVTKSLSSSLMMKL